MSEYKLINHDRGNEREFTSEQEAKDKKNDMVGLGAPPAELEIVEVGESVESDETKAESESETTDEEATTDEPTRASEVLAEETGRPKEEFEPDDIEVPDFEEQEIVPAGQGVETDPLEILPEYMIDTVKGEPTLNKRGLSVLAFHYGVTIEDREILVSPHESDWEYAIVETTVTNDDGNTFVGTGTAHVDRGDEREVLLEMAETRSYKRAVSFSTGTGIVSYQEMTNELE